MTFHDQLTLLLLDKALIGAILLVTGFGLNKLLEKTKHELGLASKRHEIALKSQIEFKEAQISELYGPIYVLLKQIRPLDDLWNDRRLGGSRNDAVLAAIRAANNRIVETVLAKSHLVEGDRIPDYFGRFLTHVSVWHAFHDDPDADWSIYAEIEEAQYDMEFEREVFRVTELLRRELRELREQLASAAPR